MKSIRDFQKVILTYWREHGRHNLPWRATKDPYHILVSEIMLQQTQVHRVIPYYKQFLKRFPTVRKLARSNLVTVLKLWSGLGYNRRAKYLRDAAIDIVKKNKGKFPHSYDALRALPGIGDYTAKAVRVFAYNEPDILIETNIRTVFIYHLFAYRFMRGRARRDMVSDSAILEIAVRAAEGQDPREWHWALMDYGAYLKRSGIKLNHKSAHYTKQSKFEGSLRQVRGAILRTLSRGENIMGLRNPYIERFDRALASLERDGLISKKKGKWRIS